MLNDINSPRFNAILHKLLGIVDDAPSPKLATEIFPVLSLEADRPEWAFLGNERLMAARGDAVAVAGNYAYVSLNNPSDSGVIVTVERVMVACSTGLTYEGVLGLGPAQAQNLTHSTPRDSRYQTPTGTFGVGAAVLRQDSQATVVNGPAFRIPNNATLEIDAPWVLAPGFALLWQHGTVATAIERVSFVWRERLLAGGETR